MDKNVFKRLFKNAIKEEWVRTDKKLHRIRLHNKNYIMVVVYKNKSDADFHAGEIRKSNSALYNAGMTTDKRYISPTSAITKKVKKYWAVYAWETCE